ncbi:molybdopterin-binding protein [Desulfatiglans anilini]|uniref:molybdopterin-binding protein n=1 Tax=Desulfatiglans anilini TaxID=90728 RepID=UPI00040C63FE|nr:molybdopterin-binding protein [Desulfatiglans anilini]
MTGKYKSSATIISVDQAVGTVLAHDITEIRPGQFKGPAFKKGHIIREEDIRHLKRLGKEHLYVLKLGRDELHEDEAALRIANVIAGPGVSFEESPSEGKIALKAARSGLLKINVEALVELNMTPEISCSSRHTNTVVQAGDILAATRAIPLILKEKTLMEALEAIRTYGPVFTVTALAQPPTGLVVTGNEVYTGLIEDKFAPILRKKLAAYGCEICKLVFSPDKLDRIVDGIRSVIQAGARLVMVAGGMSVDPDDISRLAVAEAGADPVIYGTPVLPGAMFLYGRIGEIPILGLPACVLFYRATVLDLVLPRVLAGEEITRRDLAVMAHGGMCLQCEACRYPVCPFGK